MNDRVLRGFARVGTTSFSGVGTSAMKPKQNEGNERLVSEEIFSDFALNKKVNKK